MNSSKFQLLRNHSVQTLFALTAVVIIFYITLWESLAQGQKTTVAIQKAEVVGYQILQKIQTEAGKLPGQGLEQARGIASVGSEPESDFKVEGKIGTDPWGSSYSYKVVGQNDGSSKQVLYVWSLGPNKTDDSSSEFHSALAKGAPPQFSGDDLVMAFEVND